YDPSSRIPPIEGALWPSEHLNLGHIVEFLFEEMIANKRNIIKRNGNRRIGGHGDCLGPDTSQLYAVTREVGFRECHVRNLFDKVRTTGRLCGRELFLA